MGRLSFGFGTGRQARQVGHNLVRVSQIASHGVSFTFAQPRPAGQYANGDWWVQGPVTISSITPASFVQTSGTDGNGTAYAHRVVHGAMVNPGNRAFAPGGLTANNTSNTLQSFDTLASGVSNMVYNAANNVDPGATGTPLVVSSGSVMKFVSRLTGLPINNRPVGLDMVVLTVVNDIPAGDAIRPGVSRAGNKASPCRLADANLGVFRNLAPTASAPDFATAISWVSRYIETSFPDTINNTGAKGSNNHPEYGRDIGNNLHRALLCLHLSSFTSTQKLQLLANLLAIADDIVSRMEEGAVVLAAGGGNSWKKPVVAVCAAALGAKAPASWLTWLSFANRGNWAEDSQIFAVNGSDIALSRYTADGRPRSAYTQAMLGSAEWGEQASGSPERSGSNWDAFYRDIVAYSLYPGTLAVELTFGAKALWDHDNFWRYMDTVYLRRTEGGAGNTMPAFGLEMANAYRPAKTAAPAIIEAAIKNNTIWVRFDQALNETATLPPLADFAVNVNGSPVTISTRAIWRQNLGLTLAAAVTGNDVVTLSYHGTTNRVRSVDGVNIADLSGRALANRTDRVGGPNAAFPVVRFSPGVQRTIGGTSALAPSSGALGTVALLKFRFSALPTLATEIMGQSSGTPGLRILMNTNGALEYRLTNNAGSMIARLYSPILAINTTYDIILSLDATQSTVAAGANVSVNGAAPVTAGSVLWSGGTGVVFGWNRGSTYVWNFSNNWTFDLGAFWLDATTRVDLANAANRAKFTSVTAGDLDIKTRGDGITGSVPAQFHVGNADQWNDGFGMNRGIGNRFFVTNGLLTLVSGSEWV